MPISTADVLTLASVGVVQLLAVMSPGPSFLVTVRTAVAGSRRDGLKVALGLGAGTCVWATATLAGLDALFHTVPVLFTVTKSIGALFLLWLAWRIFRHADEPAQIDAAAGAAESGLFLRGLTTQLSNPKVVVFFGSIFVAMLPATLPTWMAVALVAIVSANEIAWYSVLALFFGSPRVRARYGRAKPWIDRATGLFLGVLGGRLLIATAEA